MTLWRFLCKITSLNTSLTLFKIWRSLFVGHLAYLIVSLFPLCLSIIALFLFRCTTYYHCCLINFIFRRFNKRSCRDWWFLMNIFCVKTSRRRIWQGDHVARLRRKWTRFCWALGRIGKFKGWKGFFTCCWCL